MKRRGSSQREDRGGSDSDSDDELDLTSMQKFNSVENAKRKHEFWKLVGSMERRSQELEMLKKMRDKYEKRVKMFEEKVEGLKKTIEKAERRKAPHPLLTWENAVNDRTEMALNKHEIGFIFEYGQNLDIAWTRFEADHKNDYTLHQLNKANMDLFFRNVRSVLDGNETLFAWDVFRKIRTDSYDFNNAPDEVRNSVSELLSEFMEIDGVKTGMERFAQRPTSSARLAFSALVISARAILAVHDGEYTQAYQILEKFYKDVRRMYDR